MACCWCWKCANPSPPGFGANDPPAPLPGEVLPTEEFESEYEDSEPPEGDASDPVGVLTVTAWPTTTSDGGTGRSWDSCGGGGGAFEESASHVAIAMLLPPPPPPQMPPEDGGGGGGATMSPRRAFFSSVVRSPLGGEEASDDPATADFGNVAK